MQENNVHEIYVDDRLQKQVQAILFDKDGTLLDFTGMWGSGQIVC